MGVPDELPKRATRSANKKPSAKKGGAGGTKRKSKFKSADTICSDDDSDVDGEDRPNASLSTAGGQSKQTSAAPKRRKVSEGAKGMKARAPSSKRLSVVWLD